ncbi:MAG TPA: 16S rRNA (cytidine(1402)-2'-O)-methyltransferase [Oscillibacter sp.]|jgi:16S rRNA (cytidine1402-2'-O)-methyltransferase|nr:16S rRNA (cytidine(1402)-2'-O)-methyltransferase [Oscillibacter sp.]
MPDSPLFGSFLHYTVPAAKSNRKSRRFSRLAKRAKIGYTVSIMRNFCFLEDLMDEQKTTGTLYIVATPIGNSRDMSERGREILSTADIIAAEDTRRSVVLLNKLGIRGNSLSANHKFNEYGKAKWFIEQLASGKDIAVITDAGTPCISDPGNELIRAAVENGIRVVGVPGCCAAVNALSISGFDLSSFLFYGFFPRETADRRRVLLMMRKGDTATYAFYESPKRIMSVIDFFIEENAQLRLCLCNDMTKLHEMTFRGTPQEVKDQLIAKETYEKGEYALIVEVCDDYRLREVEHITSPEALLVDCMVRSDCTAKDAIKMLLKDENNTYSKNELYAAHLALKERFGA